MNRSLHRIALGLALSFATGAAQAAWEEALSLEPGVLPDVAIAAEESDGNDRAVRLYVSVAPNLSAGAVATAPEAHLGQLPGTGLEMGGFVQWHWDDLALSGEARAGGQSRGADIAAIYRPEGLLDGATSFRISLGADWAQGDRVPVLGQLGGLRVTPVTPDQPQGTDYSLRFSVRHNIWPGLYISGIAAAESRRQPSESASGERHVLFGAGLGLRF